MLTNLTLATGMVLLTVSLHGLGIALLGRALRLEILEERQMHLPALSLRTLAFTLGTVLALFALHGIEIWLYAFLFVLTGAVRSLEVAVYFSTISYSGIGFSDHYIAPGFRLVAGIEGINGVLLLGWSTAFFVTLVSKLGRGVP